MNVLQFFVNGKKVTEINPDPKWTLLFYLRKKLGLCGTKEACGEGGCGACTVMVSRMRRKTGEIVNYAMNACILPVCSLHGAAVVTVEGIGSLKAGLHPIQERIGKSHGTQCGYCTPGFVMSMYALLRNNPKPSKEELEDAIKGNLCRCTGYRPILDGLKSFCGAENCCRNGNGEKKGGEEQGLQRISDLVIDESEFKPYDPTQDPMFPPELQLLGEEYENDLEYSGSKITWYTPSTLDKLLELKAAKPEAKVVAGNTEIQYEVRQTGKFYPVLIHVSDVITEMSGIRIEDSKLIVGALESFSELQKFSEKMVMEDCNLLFRAIVHMLKRFGDTQTKNAATIGGSIAAGSVGSDSNTLFTAAGASVMLESRARNKREVSMDEQLFKPDGGILIEADEILTTLIIPLLEPREFLWYGKQSKRKDVDVALLNCAIKVELDEKEAVKNSKFVFNGLALQHLKVVNEIPGQLTGVSLGAETLEKLIKCTGFVLTTPPTDGTISAQYRFAMVDDMWYRFFEDLGAWKTATASNEPFEYSEGIWEGLGERKSTQMFQIVADSQQVEDLVGRPVAHLSGMQQTTGEAPYLDDIPSFENELFGAFVTSTKAHAKIVSLDYTVALAVEGVVKIYDAKSFKGGSNEYAIFNIPDEVAFADGETRAQGQPVAFVVAKSMEIAREAAKLVKIDYEEISPGILTIEDAIAADSYFGNVEVVGGNAEEALVSSEHVFDGELRLGGQKHFYMELPIAVCIPKKEDGELEIIASTQSPTYVQNVVSRCTGLTPNKVIVKVRRVGGGFGGKETRVLVLSIAAALAAQDLERPVRCSLTRAEDMQITGGRHPILCRYRIGCDSSGKISAADVQVYALAGYSSDYSTVAVGQTLRTIAAQFKIPNVTLKGYVCKSNTQSNTAMRGFGAPQGAFVAQYLVNIVADKLGLDRKKVQEMQFHQEGDTTAWGHTIERSTLSRCWEELQANSNYEERFEAVEKFNESHRLKKRGIYLMPMTFLIGYPIPFLNQGGALVMIYSDGSVSVNHGGVEMGQGLNTKMMQIASRALGVPISKIHMAETSSDKVPNTSSTAASMTADLNGPAIVDACETLKKRLEPIMTAHPEMTWEQIAFTAYFSRVNLSAVGFNKLEFEGINNYLSYGAACSEVEIDVLSGENRIVRTDIVMDVGESLNPAIDIGQIEGGFIMGTGLFTIEDVKFSADGQILATGPGTYKIPNVSNTPQEFNVSLLRGAPNPRAVYSSKAIGEPPLLLGTSVFFAIREAIKAARKQINLNPEFPMDAPATYERIRLACSSSN